MKITITQKQLLAADALPDCEAYQAFMVKFPNGVTLEWTPEKQLELLRHPVWRTVLGWLWRKSILPDRSMKNVDLSGADLSGADLSGANLNWANLREANLNGVTADKNTRWPAGFDKEHLETEKA